MSVTLADVRFIVDSLRLDSPSGEPPSDLDWPALIDHADAHSLTPLLWGVWAGREWASRIPPESRERMERALRDNEVRQGAVKADLLEIDSLLNNVGVPRIVLKGYPLAERLYADPAHRVIYDHDLLVPIDVAETGYRALLAAGFSRLPAKDAWVQKHLPSVWRNDDYRWDGYLFDPNYPRPVELHVRLWEANWRGLRVGDLPDVWADAQTRTVAGREMMVLSDEDAIVHLAMHFSVHLVEREARLNQLLDLARFVAQPVEVKWERILSKASAANASRFVYAPLFLAHKIFASPLPPADVRGRLQSETPNALQAWLAEHGVEEVLTSNYRRRSKGKDYQLTFLAARSMRERLGIVRFAALPPLEQLMMKYNVSHRWLAALMYPRFIVDRLASYGRGTIAAENSES